MKKKIVFIIPFLGGGGAEKVLVDIINYLNNNKYDLFLVLFEKKGVHLPEILSYIKIIDLKKRNRYSFFTIVFKLALLFKKIKPDIVISFMAYSNLLTILAKILSMVKFNLIISIHTLLSSDLFYARLKNIRKFLYKKLFNISNYIIVPSIGIMKELVSAFNCDQDKIRVINNPLDISKIEKLKEEPLRKTELKNNILAVGRLTRAKGYTVLIRAFSLICDMVKENLVILGNGEDEVNLKKLAQDLGLQKRVLFLGYQNNPYKFMKNASLFVLSSLWESFAIVIPEAMACGTPVISADCDSGPNEIITNGKNGVLVPPGDEKALAEAILILVENEDVRKNFSIAGRKRAEDFRIEKILPQYEELF